jgi:hypothetical protein
MAIKDYSTYIPTEGVDWAKITNDLIGNINAIGTERKAEKDAIDLITTNANALMNKDQLYSSQTFNDLMFSGVNSGREQIAKWSGELKAGTLSPESYKKRVSNLETKWTTLSNSAKTYDNANAEFMKRQIPDQKTGLSLGTNLEQYKAEIHAEIGDLANKKIFFDPNTGEPYIGKLDKEGNIDPTSLTPTFRYAAPSNFFDNTIPIDSMINSGTQEIAAYRKEYGKKTITDARQSEYTNRAIILLKNSVLSNNSYVAQVLELYSGVDYGYYRTDAEKEAKIDAMLAIEIEAKSLDGQYYSYEEKDKLRDDLAKRLILVQANSTGVYEPIITKEQRETAEKFVLDKINSQIAYDEGLDEPNYGGGGGGGGGGNKADDNTIPFVAKAVFDAVMSGDIKTLSSLAKGQKFIYNKDKGLGVVPDDEKVSPLDYRYITKVSDMYDLFGYGSAEGQEKWRKWIKQLDSQRNKK